jgi:hypothetical protein
MNAPLGTKNRPWRARIAMLNVDTVAIKQGQAVVLAMSGTGDGYGVYLPSSGAAAQNNSLFKGIADPSYISPTSTTAPTAAVGSYFDVIVGGYFAKAIICKMTKSASTAIWASIPAGAIGNQLVLDTVNNCLSNSGSAAAGAYPGIAQLLETWASATTQASDYYTTVVASTATALTTTVQVWINCLG